MVSVDAEPHVHVHVLVLVHPYSCLHRHTYYVRT